MNLHYKGNDCIKEILFQLQSETTGRLMLHSNHKVSFVGLCIYADNILGLYVLKAVTTTGCATVSDNNAGCFPYNTINRHITINVHKEVMVSKLTGQCNCMRFYAYMETNWLHLKQNIQRFLETN